MSQGTKYRDPIGRQQSTARLFLNNSGFLKKIEVQEVKALMGENHKSHLDIIHVSQVFSRIWIPFGVVEDDEPESDNFFSATVSEGNLPRQL